MCIYEYFIKNAYLISDINEYKIYIDYESKTITTIQIAWIKTCLDHLNDWLIFTMFENFIYWGEKGEFEKKHELINYHFLDRSLGNQFWGSH